MSKRLAFSTLPVLVWLCFSCSPVEIVKGPFPIQFDTLLAEGKMDYLESVSTTNPSADRPNILLILVDDLGRDDIHIYNENGVRTPNLARLAMGGATFTNAYSTSSVCSPSRASMLTGRYQQRFGFERQPMNRYPHGKWEYIFVDRFMNTEPMRLINPMSNPSEQ